MNDEDQSNLQPDPLTNFAAQNARLAARRKMAMDLIAQGIQGNGGAGYHGGRVFMVGNALGPLAKTLGGAYLNSQAEKEAVQNELAQRAAMNDFTANWQNADPATREQLLQTARNRGLDTTLEQGLLKQQEAKVERGEQLAADRQARAELEKQKASDRAEDRQAQRDFQASQNALYKRTADQMVAAAGRGSSRAPEDIELDRELKRQRLENMRNPKPPTESQGNAYLYGTRMQEADRILNDIGTSYSPMKLDIARGAEKIPGGSAAANASLLNGNDQKAMQAQRDFVNAVLRKESGAAIVESEFNNARKQYFPQPGDDPDTIKQKAANRALAISGMGKIAGPHGKDIKPTGAAPASGQWDADKEARYQEWKARNGK